MNNRKLPQSAGRATPFNYGYVIVIASFIIIMMNVGMFLTVGVFFKPISIDMGWTRADTSLPISLSTLITAAGSIIAGIMVDKFGPRKVAMVFVLFTGAGYMLMSRLSNLWEFYIYFGFMIGLGASLMVPLLSLIPRWFTHSRTVLAGVISAGGGVGGLILPLVANWLITSQGWHKAYFVMGIAYLILAVTAVQFLRRSPAFIPDAQAINIHAKENHTSNPSRESSIKQVFQSRNFWLMVIMCFSFGFIANMINLHTSPHATDIGISSTAAAGLLSIMNGFSIIGCIVLGALGDKYGNRKMLVITFIVEGVALISLIFIKQLWMLNVVMSVYGLAFGSGLAQNSPLVARLFGIGSLGLLLGIINFAQTIGSGMGSFVPGAIYDATRSYDWAFIVCGALAGSAVITMLSLKLKTSSKNV